MSPNRLAALAAVVFCVVLGGCVVAYSDQPTTTPPPPVAPPPEPPPAPAPDPDVSMFYDQLEPYGDWIQDPSYGWVWAPSGVQPFWRPYTLGHWVMSDWGWTWVSDEPFGWATYHYGRWVRAPRYGWVWVPGTVWGPAWVAWRSGPGAVGWAPLPPQVGFRVGFGLDLGGVNLDVVIQPDWWCFVEPRYLADPQVGRYAVPVARNYNYVHVTQNITNITVVNQRIVNRGIDPGEIERRSNRAIPRYRVGDLRGGPSPSRVENGEVRFYRPAVHEAPPSVAPKHAFGKPGEGPHPAPPAPNPELEKRRADADRNFDRRWNDDWNRLEKLHDQENKKVTPAPPGQAAKEEHRDEHGAAADNAYKEHQAMEERLNRQAAHPSRTVPPGQAKKAQPAAKPQKQEKKGGQQKEK